MVEADVEEYDEGDARAMSPPRSSEEVNKMTEEARATLTEYVTPGVHFANSANILFLTGVIVMEY